MDAGPMGELAERLHIFTVGVRPRTGRRALVRARRLARFRRVRRSCSSSAGGRRGRLGGSRQRGRKHEHDRADASSSQSTLSANVPDRGGLACTDLGSKAPPRNVPRSGGRARTVLPGWPPRCRIFGVFASRSRSGLEAWPSCSPGTSVESSSRMLPRSSSSRVATRTAPTAVTTSPGP
jgi:hypothetical protein